MVKPGYTKINPLKFALSAAIIMALIVILATIASIWNILGGIPALVSIIHDLYGRMGYSMNFPGALLGALYIFIDTFILTWVFAWLYNKLI